MLERNRHQPVPGGYAPSPAPYHVAQDYNGYGYGYGYGRDQFDLEERFSPLKLLTYLIRYRWLVVILCTAGLVAGAVVTMMMTPIYQATARLEVLTASAKVYRDIELVSEASDTRAFLTAREKLMSRALAERVAYELNLANNPDFLFPKAEFSVVNILYRALGRNQAPDLNNVNAQQRQRIAVSRILQGLTASVVPGTSLLSITYRSQSPEIARDVANQVAQSFIDEKVDQTTQTSTLARQFIQEQVTQAKERLQRSEQELVDYAKSAGITLTGSEQSLISSNIESLNSALSKAIEARLDAGRLVAQIDAGRGASLTQVLENEGIGKLRGQIADLSSQYQQKLGLLKPNFPEMKQLQAQINELKRLQENAIAAILDSIRLKYQEAIAREEDLRAKLAEMERLNAEYHDKNIQYTILKREVDSNRSQYESLIAKLNEASVGSELKNQNAAIVDRAMLPSAPYSPRLLINMGVGFVVFTLLAGLIIYVLELMDNTFTSPEQIEKELGLPVLGILPKVEAKELAASIDDHKSSLSEAHRSLRTSLTFAGAEGVPKLLFITSSEPSETKSTTAFKLAQDFAILGAHVLIIDADLRKPSLHRLYGVSNILGLSNLLTNTVRKEDVPGVFRKTRYEGVTVLTSGTIPPNPADLLSSTRMATLLNNVSQNFDLVIIDGPPVIGLSDAPILSRLVEGTLMIVSANQVTRKSARMALKRLRAAGANVVGAALSKFSVGKYDYDYKHLSYQYYAYGGEAPRLEDGGRDAAAATAKRSRSTLARVVRRMRGYINDFISRA